jgi:hypothetical protein
MNISCDRVRDLAPGFVLGALDAAEMDAVREHLNTCAQPHPELREMGGVLAYLGGSLDPVEPRTNLRAAVMAAAQADLLSRSPERAAATAEPVAVAEPEAPLVLTVLKPARSAGVISLGRVRALRTRRAAVWITRAAAAFAIVSLVGYAVAVQSDLNKAHETQDHANTVYSYMQVPGARSAVLTPQGGNKGVGDAVLLPSGHVIAWLHALQPTKGDEVYMVWLSFRQRPDHQGRLVHGGRSGRGLPDDGQRFALGFVVADGLPRAQHRRDVAEQPGYRGRNHLALFGA